MEKKELVQLIKKMTIDEKVDQLLQLAATFYSERAEEKTGPMTEMGLSEETLKNTGSILGVSGAAEAIRIQKEYMQTHRLNIPVLLMADIIHGYRTIFPIPLALGSSWDLHAAKQMAEISAKEAAVSGLHVTFSPMVDLVRDPRWGRVLESTGEDPYLNSQFAAAFVEGYQGTDLKNEYSHVAACVKHFAAYGAAIAGRDYNTVDMSERQLRETYLPAYKAAIDAGAKLVMTSFNTVEGIPASGNSWLLRDILREDFDFEGVVISDWGAVKELIPHGVAENEEAAAKLAIEAGVDIEMMTTCYSSYLKQLIQNDQVPAELLDESVLRILELKNDLGLFENPYRGASVEEEKKVILSENNRQAALEIAEKSMVLLKNENILPLKKEETVALIGPAAASKDVLGAWSWQGKTQEAVSLAEAVEQLGYSVLTAQEPMDYFDPSEEARNEAMELAKQADKVVLSLGEPEWMSGEAASRSDIRLPQAQIELFHAISQVNKEIVVTLYNGRPLDLTAIDDAKAIVEAWFGGTETGTALAKILWGETNPSARLSMSFPETVGQVPIYYNVDNTGRPAAPTPDEKYVSKYLDLPNEAKYPFGFGLSYSHFSYDRLTISHETFSEKDKLDVSVVVKNDSERQGTETVQLYIRDLVGQVVRPIKELKAFKQVVLDGKEEQTIRFELDSDSFKYTHQNQQFFADNGEFDIMVGSNSRDLLKKSVRLVKE